MRKEYLRPEVKVISLVSKEEIASTTEFENPDYVEGEMGLESSVFD